jgi:hypothetical protein
MLLTTYGRSCSFYIDPVEKKPQNHFLPGTLVLLFGTPGCNLACSPVKLTPWRTRPRRKPGCRSTAYPNNDPLLPVEYEERYQARRESAWQTGSDSDTDLLTLTPLIFTSLACHFASESHSIIPKALSSVSSQ